MDTDWITGKRFTVMGLGVLGGGIGVATFLASHGGLVTVTDLRDEASLAASLRELKGLPVSVHLGAHDVADFTSAGADVVVRNPGVRHDSPFLLAARQSGVAVEMEMSIFFRACPAPILGITGTKGKSTVSALVGRMFAAWQEDFLLAGNMGVSAISQLDRLSPETPVALELSSFQIEALNEQRRSPHVAVITNLSPDHLDRYDDFNHYAETKRSLLHHMNPGDVAVYNADDREVARVLERTKGIPLPFGLDERSGNAAWLAGDALQVRWLDRVLEFQRPSVLSLQGEHGARNTLAAIAASVTYGVPDEAIAAGLAAFTGVPNRLEEIAIVDGVRYINDTSATAPVAAVANLGVVRAIGDTIRLIAGGADKHADLTAFADAIVAADAHVYLLNGTATPGLERLLVDRGVRPIGRFDTMRAAVESARGHASAGDIVLLSPACASFGMFRNEFDRGNQFREAVRGISARLDKVVSS